MVTKGLVIHGQNSQNVSRQVSHKKERGGNYKVQGLRWVQIQETFI